LRKDERENENVRLKNDEGLQSRSPSRKSIIPREHRAELTLVFNGTLLSSRMNYASSLNVDSRNKALDRALFCKNDQERKRKRRRRREIYIETVACALRFLNRDGTNGQRRGRRDKRDTRDTGELSGRCFAI